MITKDLEAARMNLIALENTDRLGPDGLRELNEARAEVHRLTALAAEVPENIELIATLRRIARKADIMRIDATAEGRKAEASNANEIKLLVEIALRATGVDDTLEPEPHSLSPINGE